MQVRGGSEKQPLARALRAWGQAHERPGCLRETTLSCLRELPYPQGVAQPLRDQDGPLVDPPSKAGTCVNFLHSSSGSLPLSQKGSEAACAHTGHNALGAEMQAELRNQIREE